MQPQKKSNYVNVNLSILKGIFANHSIPIVCPKKWAETVGIKSKEDSGNLILLSIDVLGRVFSNELFPIPVSRKWLETLHITIEKEAQPIVVDEAAFSVKPVSDFEIPKLEEPSVEVKEEKVDDSPSGAVSFGTSEEEEPEPSGAVSFGTSAPSEEEYVEEPEEIKAPKTTYSDWG